MDLMCRYTNYQFTKQHFFYIYQAIPKFRCSFDFTRIFVCLFVRLLVYFITQKSIRANTNIKLHRIEYKSGETEIENSCTLKQRQRERERKRSKLFAIQQEIDRFSDAKNFSRAKWISELGGEKFVTRKVNNGHCNFVPNVLSFQSS